MRRQSSWQFLKEESKLLNLPASISNKKKRKKHQRKCGGNLRESQMGAGAENWHANR